MTKKLLLIKTLENFKREKILLIKTLEIKTLEKFKRHNPNWDDKRKTSKYKFDFFFFIMVKKIKVWGSSEVFKK